MPVDVAGTGCLGRKVRLCGKESVKLQSIGLFCIFYPVGSGEALKAFQGR